MPRTVGRVLVTGSSVTDRYLSKLRESGLDVVNPKASFAPSKLSPEILQQLLQDCDAYLLGGDERATREVLSSAKHLQVIAFLGVGYDSFIDIQAADDLGIPVTYTPGVLSNSVAELTVGLTIEARRKIINFAFPQLAGEPSATDQEKRSDLAGHPVGIIGLGGIGTRIAEILRFGFSSDVIYFSRTRKPEEEQRLGLRYLPLADMVREVETLILIVPETDDTIKMVNWELLSSHHGAPLTIVCPARPEVVDAEGLLRALDAGVVESIWFDDFYRDVTPAAAALRTRREVRVTPHIGSLTHDARDAMAQMAITSLLDVLAGKEDPNTVTRSKLRR